MSILPVTEANVQAIYAIPDGLSVSSYIQMGNDLMNAWAAVMPYPDNVLFQIQVNLVAHLMQTFEPQSIRYAGVSISQKGIGDFLKEGPYGRNCLLFDTRGFLGGFGRRKAKVFSIGGYGRGCC